MDSIIIQKSCQHQNQTMTAAAIINYLLNVHLIAIKISILIIKVKIA